MNKMYEKNLNEILEIGIIPIQSIKSVFPEMEPSEFKRIQMH